MRTSGVTRAAPDRFPLAWGKEMGFSGWALLAWAVLAIAAVTWPFALPGEFAWRDMVLLDRPAMSPGNFGAGALPARNAPQDGVLALAGAFGAGAWAARVAIFCAAGAAAWAAARWARNTVAAAAAIAVAVANPFVIERLLQGQWSLVVAAWLLPVIAWAGVHRRHGLSWAAMWLASLSPSGAMLGVITAVASNSGARLRTLVLGAVASLAWVIPGLSAHSVPGDPAAAVAAFAPRAEAWVGTAGALLTTGGLWNAEAVPASRSQGFAVAGLALTALAVVGVRRQTGRRVAVALAAAGIGGAIVCWLLPGALAWLVAEIPGAGLLRDAHKLSALGLPLLVAGVGGLTRWPAGAALLAAVLQVYDAPVEVGVLSPRPTGVNPALVEELDGRTAFFPERPNLIALPATESAPEAVALDPYAKAVSLVEPGSLVVDGKVIDATSPRYAAAQLAWREGDLARLEELGVGAVVVDERIVAETGAAAPRPPWALTVLWLALPLLINVCRPRRAQTTTRQSAGR